MAPVTKQWIPSAILHLYRLVRGRIRPTWSGVYPTYRDVPVQGAGFDGDVWIGITRTYTEAAIRSSRIEKAGPSDEDRALLPTLARRLADSQSLIGVLDFGGGMGVGYVDVRRALGPRARVRYVVIEAPVVCAEGQRLWADDPEITFVRQLRDVPHETFDVLYISSALQYVEDWRGLLRGLLAHRPAHVLLANISAGDIPTYATAQLNVPGSVLAYWFLNLGELTSLMRAEGYALHSSTLSQRRLVGLAVPSTHRIDRGRNLVFDLALEASAVRRM